MLLQDIITMEGSTKAALPNKSHVEYSSQYASISRALDPKQVHVNQSKLPLCTTPLHMNQKTKAARSKEDTQSVLPCHIHPSKWPTPKANAQEAVRTPRTCRLPSPTRQPSTVPKRYSQSVLRSIARKGRHNNKSGRRHAATPEPRLKVQQGPKPCP